MSKFTLQELKEFNKDLFLVINQLTKYMETNFDFKLVMIDRVYDLNHYMFNIYYSYTRYNKSYNGVFNIDLSKNTLGVQALSRWIDIPLRKFGDVFKAHNLFLIYLSIIEGESILFEHIEKLSPSCAQKLKANYDFSGYNSKTKATIFIKDADGLPHMLDCWGGRFEDFVRTGNFECLVSR